MPDNDLRIIGLQAENFKRLRAIEIHPGDDPVVMITGRNGQGKSSVLDAIMAALGGARALPEQPIRQGAERSKITVDLGDMIVERTITHGGGTVKVRAKDGTSFQSPQALLDALTGRIAFDPLAFMRQKGADQVKQLLDVVDLGFNPAELDAQRAELDRQFIDAGREVKRLTGVHDSTPKPTVTAARAEVSVADLTAEYQRLSAANDERKRAHDAAERLARDEYDANDLVNGLKHQIAELNDRLAEAEANQETAAGLALDAYETARAMPVHDLSAIMEQLRGAEATNSAIRQAREYHRVETELKAALDVRQKLGRQRDDVDRRKAELLAAAQMPVPGLSFDSNRLLLNKIPIEQCSASEQLRVAVAIAMALNPRLRVILIRDGSLLDSESRGVLAELAGQQGYQIWLEHVDESGEMGIVIEDGAIVPTFDDHLAGVG